VAGFSYEFFGNIGKVVVDLVIVCTVATPNAFPAGIVEAETLGARHERMQQAFRLADVFPRLQVVQIR
jgi:hypothetical protein